MSIILPHRINWKGEETSNIFAKLVHGILIFFQEFPSGAEAKSIVSGPNFRERKSLRGEQHAWRDGRPLPSSLWKKAIIGLTCQFSAFAQQHWPTKFCNFAFFVRIVLISLVLYIFGILASFDHRVHARVVMKFADFMLFSCPPPYLVLKLCLILRKFVLSFQRYSKI